MDEWVSRIYFSTVTTSQQNSFSSRQPTHDTAILLYENVVQKKQTTVRNTH